MSFRGQYGPWGIVAGASEGLGAAYAEALAARGLNVVLIARRLALLQSVAGALAAKYGIEATSLAIDLAAADAAEQVLKGTSGLEVGLLVYNAAFSAIGPFLDRPPEAHLREMHTNALTPLRLVHACASPMLARGRGGIVLMSSLSAFQGSAYIATYAGTKAFNLVLAEGLWDEWRDSGVDALVCVSGAVRTPNYVASEPERTGALGEMALEPKQVVQEALDALGKRPYVIPGRMNRAASFVMRHLLPRRTAIGIMGRTLRRMYESAPEKDQRSMGRKGRKVP